MTFQVQQEQEKDLLGVFRVEVAEEWVKEEENRVASALGKVVQVDGFRKGKVPGKIVQRLFPERVAVMVVDAVMNRVRDEELKEMGCLALGQERITEHSREKGKGLTVSFAVSVLKRDVLPDFSKWTLEKYLYPISEQNVDDAIENLRQKMISLTEKEEGACELGDVIVVDLQVLEGGMPVLGQKTEKPVALEMGLNSLGQGCDEQLMGVKSGEVRRVSVLQRSEDRDAGQERRVEYEVTVRQLYSRVLPELDEDFFEKASQGQAKDETSFREVMKGYLAREVERRQRWEMHGQIRDRLAEESPWVPPQDLVKEQFQHLKEGLSPEDLENLGPEQENRLMNSANKQIKVHFLVEALAVDMGIRVSKEEVDEVIKKSSSKNKQTMEDEATRNSLSFAMLSDRVYDRILFSTNIKEMQMKSMESVLS